MGSCRSVSSPKRLGWRLSPVFAFTGRFRFAGAQKSYDGQSYQQEQNDRGNPMAKFHEICFADQCSKKRLLPSLGPALTFVTCCIPVLVLESPTAMRGYLLSLFDEVGQDLRLNQPWKPVSRLVLAAWLVFYVAFLGYAFSAHGGFLFIDMPNLIVHEGGHNLFGWFRPTLGLC